jgi:hypothetical protein
VIPFAPAKLQPMVEERSEGRARSHAAREWIAYSGQLADSKGTFLCACQTRAKTVLSRVKSIAKRWFRSARRNRLGQYPAI